MKSLLQNWKTTSAGVLMIGGSLIHLGFQIKNHTADEGAFYATLVGIVGGIGLMAAGDAKPSNTIP